MQDQVEARHYVFPWFLLLPCPIPLLPYQTTIVYGFSLEGLFLANTAKIQEPFPLGWWILAEHRWLFHSKCHVEMNGWNGCQAGGEFSILSSWSPLGVETMWWRLGALKSHNNKFEWLLTLLIRYVSYSLQTPVSSVVKWRLYRANLCMWVIGRVKWTNAFTHGT